MSKVTLNDVGSLVDALTAQTTINTNNTTIETAFDNTLSRDGSQPNVMHSVIDMNNNPIVNLPTPIGGTSPLRLEDLTSFIGGGTLQTIPVGGTTGQSLQKASNTNYDVNWGNSVSSVGLSLPAEFTITNSPVTASGTLTGAWVTPVTGTGGVVKATSPSLITPTLSTPTLTNAILGTPTSATLTNATGLPISTGVSGLGTGVATFLATPTSANLIAAVTNETGSGALVFGTSPTLTTPVFSSIVNTGTLTLPTSTDTLIGKATTDTLTNKTFDTGGTGNSFSINGVATSRGQYPGVNAATSATAGNIGEYVESIIASPGSALTSSTAANVTSISLTAGDWDVNGVFYVSMGSGTTSITDISLYLSLVTGTADVTPGRFAQFVCPAVIPGNAVVMNQLVGPYRFNLASTTTIFLVGLTLFTSTAPTGYGIIRARRIH